MKKSISRDFSFLNPIIVMPGGWGDSLPEWIKEAIFIKRLDNDLKHCSAGTCEGQTPEPLSMVSDAEVCAYLYTASLTAPLYYDWAQIYLYVARSAMVEYWRPDVPGDIKVAELSTYQQELLSRLKHWLYVKAKQSTNKGE
jgi:hypothetical protein